MGVAYQGFAGPLKIFLCWVWPRALRMLKMRRASRSFWRRWRLWRLSEVRWDEMKRFWRGSRRSCAGGQSLVDWVWRRCQTCMSRATLRGWLRLPQLGELIAQVQHGEYVPSAHSCQGWQAQPTQTHKGQRWVASRDTDFRIFTVT